MSSAPTKSLQNGVNDSKQRRSVPAWKRSFFVLLSLLEEVLGSRPGWPSERHPTPFDIPMRWDPQRELTVRALRVAFADFSAAPWQGFEKSERCPNNSSLFRPQAAVVVVAVQVLAGNKKGHPDGCSFLLPART